MTPSLCASHQATERIATESPRSPRMLLRDHGVLGGQPSRCLRGQTADRSSNAGAGAACADRRHAIDAIRLLEHLVAAVEPRLFPARERLQEGVDEALVAVGARALRGIPAL